MNIYMGEPVSIRSMTCEDIYMFVYHPLENEYIVKLKYDGTGFMSSHSLQLAWNMAYTSTDEMAVVEKRVFFCDFLKCPC